MNNRANAVVTRLSLQWSEIRSLGAGPWPDGCRPAPRTQPPVQSPSRCPRRWMSAPRSTAAIECSADKSPRVERGPPREAAVRLSTESRPHNRRFSRASAPAGSRVARQIREAQGATVSEQATNTRKEMGLSTKRRLTGPSASPGECRGTLMTYFGR